MKNLTAPLLLVATLGCGGPAPGSTPTIEAAAARETPPVRVSTSHRYRISTLDEVPATESLERVVIVTFGTDGRKLREEARGPDGEVLHTFTVLYGATDQPIGMAAFYAQDGVVPSLEVFEHSDREGGRRRTITYLEADGRITSRAEYDFDERGHNVERRYQRADGTVYGFDTERYDERGDSLGWTFERVDGSLRVVNEFRYLEYDEHGTWTRRVHLRDGQPISLHLRRLEYRD